MTLQNPIWLFLLIPLVVTLFLWRLPSRLLLGLRILGLLLILLSILGLAVRLPSRAATIVMVIDRSDSMPERSSDLQGDAVELVRKSMKTGDRLHIVTFGRKTALEKTPEEGKESRFINEVGGDASNLAEALDRALSLIPKGSPGRIFVLSDGRWTGKDPQVAASKAAALNIPIDFRPMARSSANDLAIQRLDVPESVQPGESFLLVAWIHSPTAQKARVSLRRGNKVLVSEEQHLEAGLTPIRFRDRAPEPGTLSYSVEATSEKEDPITENNRARSLIGVHGSRPILHVSQSGSSGLASILRKGKIQIREKKPSQCNWTLEELSRYSAVILENVPANEIKEAGMTTIAAWVRETGSGLMMTGGRDSYAPGGYYRSPLASILPVSMELRQEHRKLSLAIVVALDRSGSMSAPAGGGRTKMDLANQGTAEVVKLLSAMDEVGVIAVDSEPHVIADIAPVTDKGSLRDKILRIKSMGGGIFVHRALKASFDMVRRAKAGTRHIILFADARDAERPEDYKKLLAECQKAGVTVSVIGLGEDTDKDAELLRDVAKLGKGRCFFTSKAEELPRLFAQDTFVVARNTFLDEATKIRSTGGPLVSLIGRDFQFKETIGGYNLCYTKREASMSVRTIDEYKAPVVASWHAGSGRVLCYTGEADGKYLGNMKKWEKVGDFFTSLARWTAGKTEVLPGNMVVTQEVRKGVNVVKLHLDPDRKSDPFQRIPQVTTLKSTGGRPPEKSVARMRWEDADTMVLEVPVQGSEVALSSVVIDARKPKALPPVCLPYSPEHEPVDNQSGVPALQQISRATNGKERAELTGIWKDIPRQPRLISIAMWLLIAAIVVFLLEVLERRTSLLSRMQSLVWAPDRERRVKKETIRKARKRKVEKVETATEEAPAPTPSPVVEEGGVVSALRQARQRTKRKYGRKD